jgi:hypothetical protein
MHLYSGKRFWPLDPHPDDIEIMDIAHSLSLQCRFAGHTKEHYSVAKHSLHVAELVPKKYFLEALLHDASEAYLVDLPRPIKNFSAMGREYKKIETRIQKVINEKFRAIETPKCVLDADNRVLMAEARDLLKVDPKTWDPSIIPRKNSVVQWLQGIKKTLFLYALVEEVHKRN